MSDEPEGSSPGGKLAHRMNNAVAYVLTNLNLVGEELDEWQDADGRAAERRRLVQLVVEATAGVNRISDLIRELKVMSWTARQDGAQSDPLGEGDDTWDEERRPRRILIVDDEPYILASIRRALRHYDVTVAEGGSQAIDLLKGEDAFDLVLCDLVMATVTGMQVYRWVQENRPAAVERMIFMTAGAFTSEVREFLATVRNPVLHKPFDTKTLRWMIAQSVKRTASS